MAASDQSGAPTEQARKSSKSDPGRIPPDRVEKTWIFYGSTFGVHVPKPVPSGGV